jgi:AraC family transcriptional regulator, regulatory protein of adaptative response / methylphosphotriester-DNA alkyltransferase methyltransferase
MRVTELALSQAVLPSLAKVGIHEVEQLAEHTTGELLRRPEFSRGVELEAMRPQTFRERRRLYLLARVVIMRHYRTSLTIEAVAKSLASSPRQLQRAFAQFGNHTFREDLRARRLAAAAELLSQCAIPVCEVARLVGYRQPAHFARAFRCLYGVPPTVFRDELHQAKCREAPGTIAA